MFCRYCGKELIDAPGFCTNCGSSPMAGTSFCPGCGAATTSTTKVCSQCGLRLPKAMAARTWKPTAAAILTILPGALGVVELVLVIVLVALYLKWPGISSLLRDLGGVVAIVLAIAVPPKIVAILGGISCLSRRRWGLALAGSICAMFSSVLILLTVPLAIAAIVLVVLGKGEFE